eukprot:scaffold4815_cov107-Cylindrotheca_fusiformis.AAC.6
MALDLVNVFHRDAGTSRNQEFVAAIVAGRDHDQEAMAEQIAYLWLPSSGHVFLHQLSLFVDLLRDLYQKVLSMNYGTGGIDKEWNPSPAGLKDQNDFRIFHFYQRSIR